MLLQIVATFYSAESNHISSFLVKKMMSVILYYLAETVQLSHPCTHMWKLLKFFDNALPKLSLLY